MTVHPCVCNVQAPPNESHQALHAWYPVCSMLLGDTGHALLAMRLYCHCAGTDEQAHQIDSSPASLSGSTSEST